ncbi:F0F1 ATP synthase subunit delta [Phytoactinopolyspora halotolerans]|uniref:ATP synthase subunit delta n=1 Tax=Phytoactinopolyspora halotolerans TaxID=1981512 RepID=A0A6L9S734_9ACTN|nr:F0F1 ATP synthase subunit delta [Phytoactinopolyspora halotolerans]NEE00571.1 F0F1 ATP synthase subunit delta [Phytoactinopolyspora halotolerans]
MLGSSRSSFAAAREALAERDVASESDLSAELLAIANALAGSAGLRGALSDSGTEAAKRVALARSVFEGKISSAAMEVLTDLAGRRWNSGSDLVDAVEGLGFEAALITVEAAGRLDTVEDELFRIERLIAGDDQLRQALSDRAVEPQAKAELMHSLLEGVADPVTQGLVRQLVEHPRGRQLGEALTALVEQSSRRRQHLLATVTVAAPISADHQTRLAAALGRIYRREIDIQLEIDPEVLGGVKVRIGDEVIDGSVAHRLEGIRRRLAG